MKRLILVLFMALAFSMLWSQTTVFDIQYSEDPDGISPLDGQTISTGGVVTGIQGTSFYMTDYNDGGAWHGVYVFTYDDYSLQIGDYVSFGAEVDEYYGMTELKNLTDFMIISSGNVVPDPVVVTTGDLASSEAYEGVLVKIEDVTVTVDINNYGEWYVDDGSGNTQVDDNMYSYTPALGDMFYSITGCVDYSYDYYGLLPRSENDIDPVVPGESCEFPLIANNDDNSSPQAPIWYEYTATVTGQVTISSCVEGQSEDTKLYVYEDCGGTQIAYNDDAYCSSYNYSSLVTFNIQAGESYIVYWDDDYSSAAFDWWIDEVENLVPEIVDYTLGQGVDLPNFFPIENNVVVLDPLYEYTYLTTTEFNTTLPLMQNEMNPFYIETYPEGWFDYWATRGVVEGATGWQAIAWDIINANAPIVYLLDNGTETMLVDGLLYQLTQEITYLRINGDYLLGDYSITGTILSDAGVSSEAITIPITFEEPFVAPPGYDCATPYVIEGIPFIQTGFTTEGFGDDYDNSCACSSSYMNGDDFVFEYVPDQDIMVDIALTNTDTWTGVFVVQGVIDDPGATCVDYGTSSSGNPSVLAVPLSMGETYYILISTWPTPNFTPFDISITEYIPPVYGDLSGYVTDFDSGEPIEGASVTLIPAGDRMRYDKDELSPEKIAYLRNELTRNMEATTDANGYYEFWDVDLGPWSLEGSAEGYENYSDQLEIIEGANSFDFMMTALPAWNTQVQITTDSWGYETSWNLWDYNNDSWWYAENIGETETLDDNTTYDWYLNLPAGLYELYVWDVYGDGGSSGYVFDYDSNVLLSWTGDYDDVFTGMLPIDVMMGDYCQYPLNYGNINDPAATGSIESLQAVWYEVNLDQNYTSVGFSLLNSDYDTKLEIWADCGDDTYIGYNDDWYGRSTPLVQTTVNKSQSRVTQSYIGFDVLEAGTYYAKVYGYGSASGNYELEVTGSLEPLTPEIDSYSLVSSTDLVEWNSVYNDIVEVDPEIDYTYLNVNTMTTNVPLMTETMNEFFVDTYPEGWFDYWAAKGVIEGATGWQAVMWDIINGNAPIFYLMYDGTDYTLVDGLLYQIGEGEQNLRITGDYLMGDYTYTGTVLSEEGAISEAITLPITFIQPIVYIDGDAPSTAFVIDALPYFDSGDTSVDYTNWGNNAAPDVFYSLTIPEDMMLDIYTCGSEFDTYLRLFDDTMTQVASDDDGCSGYPTGLSSASWIEQYEASAGTYYIMVEGYSSHSGYYELNVEEYIPPTYGDLTGYITDADTGYPLEGVEVNVNVAAETRSKVGLSDKEIEYLESVPMMRLATTTDANGYYEFLDLETGMYDLSCDLSLYESQTIQYEVLEGANSQDFALVPITAWSIYLGLTVDGYASEASFNLWNVDTETWYWDTDQTFSADYETLDYYLVLAPGTYDVYCYDSYGDGGISGLVQDENSVELQSWLDTDYEDLGVFRFYNDLEPGSICQVPIPYYNINDPAQTGSIESYQSVWYEFYLNETCNNVIVSLLNSDYDTKLEIWSDCDDDTYLAYNDDWSGRGALTQRENVDKTQSRVLQSQIVFDQLEPGNYYAKVYGYTSASGNYELEITGTIPGETVEAAIIVDYDESNYYNGSGDLSLYADDYDLPSLDGADVVYSLTIPVQALVDVSLLNSDFDTKFALYASDVVPGPDNYLFYNDDYYGRFGGYELVDWARPVQENKENSRVLQSAIYDMLLDAGTYYIVVDGYDGETGMWDIEVNWEDACQALECTGTPEGEDMIADGGSDVTNGGCNMEEPLFSSIMPGETVCGMLNTYINASENNSRDMDWYLGNTGDEFDYYEVTVTLDCDFGDAALWLTNGLCGDDMVVYGFYNETGYCSYEQGVFQVVAGDFGIIVAPPTYDGFPDGFNYALNVEVAEYIPPEDVFINVTVDNYPSEASWNVYDYQSESFLYTQDMTFTSSGETQNLALILDPGMYSVVCYDSYGDGGIGGNVIHLTQTLVSWTDDDYDSEAWFDFEIAQGMIYGDVDGNGAVEAFDTSNLLQYVVGLDPDAVPLPWEDETIAAADVDGNFWINAYDGSLILQYVVGYIDIFPVEEMVRYDAPEASVNVEFIDNELIFTSNGDLYSFEATVSSAMGTPETDVLYAVNGNQIALASADVITGEFLRIPVSEDMVTIDMVINNATERIDLTSAPSVTSLMSNYPNPFNPTTTISYNIKEAGNVLIQVYNVKGQLVSTLVNEKKDAGSYDIQWNADGLASGVYFYKMKFGRYTSTKKMILMK